MWKYLGCDGQDACEMQEMFLQDKILRNQAGHLEMKRALMFHPTACSPPLTDLFPQRLSHNTNIYVHKGKRWPLILNDKKTFASKHKKCVFYTVKG